MTIQQFNIDGTVATLGRSSVGGLPREGITYTYNDAGLPDRMVGDMVTTGDTQVYVDSTSYTAYGETAQRTLGASYENQVYHTYSYADGTRRVQEFVGDAPFDCLLWPGSDMCELDYKEWLGDDTTPGAYEHLRLAIGVCDAAVCVELSFQGGVIAISAGVGGAGVGGSITWDAATPDETGSLSIGGCAAFYVGACGTWSPRVTESGEWVGSAYEVGIAFGMGVPRAVFSVQVLSYNVHTGEWGGLENPFPRSATDRFFQSCPVAWWDCLGW